MCCDVNSADDENTVIVDRPVSSNSAATFHGLTVSVRSKYNSPEDDEAGVTVEAPPLHPYGVS